MLEPKMSQDEVKERDTLELLRGLCLVEREAVLMQLEKTDPEAAERARVRLDETGSSRA